ncbi:MAG: SAVED domain-containing protein [Verrucomicrobiota bacterium]
MAKANTARMQGDDYQTYYFWLKACDLFLTNRGVEKVALEQTGVKAFDDVVVYYRAGANFDGDEPINADYFQVKYHVAANGAITAVGLTEPSFINATSVSLLERLQSAQKAYAPDGKGARFHLYSPWTVHPDDRLAEIYSQYDGRLNLDKLFSGKKTHKFGKVRELWKKHLKLSTDEELKAVVTPLRLITGGMMSTLQDQLSGAVQLAGLAPLSKGTRLKHYDDLARKLMAEGVIEFDRDALEAICRRENLWNGGPAMTIEAIRVGIRTFKRGAGQLGGQQEHFLDLLDRFDGRNLQAGRTWENDILPVVRDFLETNLEGKKRCLLTLATHLTIAYVTGHTLDPKMGVEIILLQNGSNGEHAWTFDDETSSADHGPEWKVEEVALGDGPEQAVAISLTHDVQLDVAEYLRKDRPQIGSIIHFTAANGFGQGAVKGGAHARRLAEELVRVVREERTTAGRATPLHLFVSAPNAFVVALGRLGRALGKVSLYEHDFGSGLTGAYAPSLTI